MVAVALVAVLAGPAAYSLATAATPHSGAIPSAGPSSGSGPGFGGPAIGRGPRAPGGAVRAPGGAGAGGLLNTSTPSAALVDLLQRDAGDFSWVAAVVQSNQAAGYQLASGEPVMAIGGFNGTDPAPTLAQFEALVRAGRIHYFVASGGDAGFAPASSSSTTTTASRITAWIESHFTAQTVGGVTVYDLTT